MRGNEMVVVSCWLQKFLEKMRMLGNLLLYFHKFVVLTPRWKF